MGKRYQNPHTQDIKRNFWHFLLWRMGFYNNPYQQCYEIPKDFKFPFTPSFEKGKPSLVWINHSSFLLQCQGIHILTDPIWSDSPFPFLGPKRKHPPALALELLPEIDFVLLSHDHYDHMDKKTLLTLKKQFPHIHWIVPKGVEHWFQKKKFPSVFPMNWEEKKDFSHLPTTVTIHAVPAQHFSGRCFFDTNKSRWNGYVVEIGEVDSRKTLYFVGDTGYNPYDFKEIGKNWNIDLSLIPIGSFAPRGFMKAVHVNPSEAVEIHKDCQSTFSVAMHHQTFSLSDEPLNFPSYALYLALKEKKVSPASFSVILPGQYVNW